MGNIGCQYQSNRPETFVATFQHPQFPRALILNGGNDLPSDAVRLSFHLVLPEVKNCPPLRAKPPADPFISCPVVFDFVFPELDVGPRQIFALGTPVPKTTIHEDRDLASGPREIRPTRYSPMLSVSTQPNRP
jgi:hypothetical protein